MLFRSSLEILKSSDWFDIPSDGLQGKRFGVIIVNPKEGDAMEIAAFRKDITKGRNPKVKVGVSIEDDVKRRDLTFNALFYDMDSKEVVDLVGGVSDLENKIIKMVGNAMDRIKEDPLRILRVFRFASKYGSELTDEIIEAIKKNNKLELVVDDELQRVSQEAILVEFEKAWKKAKDFTQYLKFITEFEMWNEIFPGVAINTDVKPTTDFVVMLAQLFSKTKKKDLRNFLVEKLKFPDKPGTKTASKVDFLLKVKKMKKDDVIDFYKGFKRLHMDKGTISEFYRVFGLEDKYFWAFLKFEPIANTKDLIKQGFKGVELGAEIDRVNKEAFEKLL